mmetsp:Transcript_56109/g.126624  ORF Transcript_56109/g.126624 Transcript_56109/m.126624 type:complete len:258 (-) Transcript_56109:204-977(-)
MERASTVPHRALLEVPEVVRGKLLHVPNAFLEVAPLVLLLGAIAQLPAVHARLALPPPALPDAASAELRAPSPLGPLFPAAVDGPVDNERLVAGSARQALPLLQLPAVGRVVVGNVDAPVLPGRRPEEALPPHRHGPLQVVLRDGRVVAPPPLDRGAVGRSVQAELGEPGWSDLANTTSRNDEPLRRLLAGGVGTVPDLQLAGILDLPIGHGPALGGVLLPGYERGFVTQRHVLFHDIHAVRADALTPVGLPPLETS